MASLRRTSWEPLCWFGRQSKETTPAQPCIGSCRDHSNCNSRRMAVARSGCCNHCLVMSLFRGASFRLFLRVTRRALCTSSRIPTLCRSPRPTSPLPSTSETGAKCTRPPGPSSLLPSSASPLGTRPLPPRPPRRRPVRSRVDGQISTRENLVCFTAARRPLANCDIRSRPVFPSRSPLTTAEAPLPTALRLVGPSRAGFFTNCWLL